MTLDALGPEHRLASYGTLAPGRRNHHQMDGMTGTWSSGTVRGRLRPEGWGAGEGYPGIVLDDAADVVAVDLFTSSDLPAHWARLDEFEGADYVRQVVMVQTGDGPVSACIYALADE